MATQLTTAEQNAAQLPQSPEAERFSLMQRQARLFAQSPLIPQHLRNGTPEQAMANCYIAMTIADRMGEDRMTVMQNIHIVHGTAGFKAQYMIARANASGVFKDGIDWTIEGKGKDLSVTAFATLASTGRRVEITVDMVMAEAEGWTKNPKYKTMPEIMLRYRSGTFLVRMYAPQVMLGYQTVEEREDLGFAAAPIAEPLTGQALLDQAAPAETIDAETGEVSEEVPAQPGFNLADDSDDPAVAKADELIAAMDAATDAKALEKLIGEAERHKPAMPDEIQMKLEVAYSRNRGRVAEKEGAE
jgi:hypothetical protein